MPTDRLAAVQMDVVHPGVKSTSYLSPDLLDSMGDPIRATGHWYKIMLADGKELGWNALDQNASTCGPVAAGEGAIFRFITPISGRDTWPERYWGSLKAMGLTGDNGDGELLIGFLTLNEDNPPVLVFRDTLDQERFMFGVNAPGNRFLMTTLDNDTEVGLRVHRKAEMSSVMQMPASSVFWTALDCQFVPCGPYTDSRWEF